MFEFRKLLPSPVDVQYCENIIVQIILYEYLFVVFILMDYLMWKMVHFFQIFWNGSL